MAENRGERVGEVCKCHHLKSKHLGLQGHGVCTICECPFYTFMGWVYKEVLVLRDGDNVLQELRNTLFRKQMKQNVFLVSVEVLKMHEFDVSLEVLYAWTS